MRVRILVSIIGKPSYSIGELVELEPRIAKAWILDGLARQLDGEELLEAAIKQDLRETR